MPIKTDKANIKNGRLLSLVDEYCPYCDKTHKVQKMVSKSFPVYFKGKKLLCDEVYFRCPKYVDEYGAFESCWWYNRTKLREAQ